MEETIEAPSQTVRPAEPPHHEPPLSEPRAKRLYVISAIVIALLLLLYVIYRVVASSKESTDDAQVAADVVPVAARVAGQIATVLVRENQPVRAGQLIAEIDSRDAAVKLQQAESELLTARAQADDAMARVTVTRANASGGFDAARAAVQSSRENVDTSVSAIAEARAALARAEANATKAAGDYRRASELGEKGDISRAQVDAARAANDSAQADVASARARLTSAENSRQLAQSNVLQAEGKLQQSSPVAAQVSAAEAQADLARAKIGAAEAAVKAARLAVSYTRIFAPADGIASKLAVHPGSMISVGQAIVQLVPRRTYVVANFKETQMRDVKSGQRARITIDMLGGKEFEGKVESLSGGTGASFSLLPPDNASGNFVKVVQRVPVRISWSGPGSDEVPVGSSAEVTVYTK
jgi:membrane fusion protein (multidrug efflux system)